MQRSCGYIEIYFDLFVSSLRATSSSYKYQPMIQLFLFSLLGFLRLNSWTKSPLFNPLIYYSSLNLSLVAKYASHYLVIILKHFTSMRFCFTPVTLCPFGMRPCFSRKLLFILTVMIIRSYMFCVFLFYSLHVFFISRCNFHRVI